ncbi:MAG: YhcH/YjgK/YiaL family protein [Methylotenera sp.]|nr:YhcH/YjgK/YiaL family protein [Methylotenera sp.]MDD4926530.1 YhcH/YjgK/YiaL family protein [Methylotenera sp.]
MILDTIANAERYLALHPLFAQVFTYMRNTDLQALACGRHTIIGDDVFAIVERVSGRTRESAQLECHRKYIDIQLVLNGTDEMGWKPLADCRNPVSAFNTASDIQFFHDVPASWVSTPTNIFCIFFPEDTHAPLIANQPIHKIVFKIAVNATDR